MLTTTITVLCILLYSLAFSNGQFDFDDLGDLGGLDGLGARINSDVQRQLAPLRGLGDRITKNVQQQTAHLEGLGAAIEKQVYDGLKPVRILQSKLNVRFGNYGTTVATFNPGGKQFIIRKGTLYECTGTIDNSAGTCSGNLKKFKFEEKKDFCYSNSKAVLNDWYCLTPEGASTTGFINGKIICEGMNGSPTLLIKRDEYKELCKDVANSVDYKYWTNRNLQDIGEGLRCSGNYPQICVYSETSNNNNVDLSNGGTIISY